MSMIFTLMDKLAPLHRRKSSGLAAFLGFVLGGVGLGIYFRSFVDFLFPIGLAIAASVFWSGLANLDGGTAVLAGSIMASLYGYFRAENSNQRLLAKPS
jgi:hypothetical protein